jgi:hypothetical protein
MTAQHESIEIGPAASESNSHGRNFLVSRQDAESRAFKPVGILCAQTDGFIFEYFEEFLAGENPQALGGLALDKSPFVSPRLYPVFAERITGAHRVDKDAKLESLGLTQTASDLDILSRSEGVRPVDSIRLTELIDLSTGVIDLKFFVHGVRYQPKFEEVLSDLRVGSPLKLVPEPNNEADSSAILIAANGRPIGYVPHALSLLLSLSNATHANVVRVNSPAVGGNLRLLVHVEGNVDTEFEWPWHREATIFTS